jgi:alpha-L-arabinofuranosidase
MRPLINMPEATVKQTEVQIHPAYIIGQVSPFIFGGFIEHIGRCVYEGVYDPGSKCALSGTVYGF